MSEMSWPAAFYLVPLNVNACDALTLRENQWHLRALPNTDIPALRVPLKPADNTKELLTIGRQGDIKLEDWESISDLHCSFERLRNGVIVARDYSQQKNVRFVGSDACEISNQDPRQVVIRHGINTQLELGQSPHQKVAFELVWIHEKPTAVDQPRDARLEKFVLVEKDPNADDFEEDAPKYTTLNLTLRFAGEEAVRYGSFGKAFVTTDIDTGRKVAVIRLRVPPGQGLEYQCVQEDVRKISQLKHKHLLNFIGSQWIGDISIGMFFNLQGKILTSLVQSNALPAETLANLVFEQMIDALAYLEEMEFVHGELEPDNIYYHQDEEDNYVFELGNFGLCRRHSSREDRRTSLYVAPEGNLGAKSTGKQDIWSLFVTVLWILNHEGFRKRSATFKSAGQAQMAVLRAAEGTVLRKGLEAMATYSAETRPSAKRLARLFLSSKEEVKVEEEVQTESV